jgi:hypothetical protein
MKNIRTYAITVAAILTSLLGACSQMNAGGLKRFDCTLESVNPDPYRQNSKGDLIMHYAYNKEESKITLISIKSFNINKSGEESIMDETFNAYEKEGELLWKRGGSHFLAMDTMKLRVDDGYTQGETEYYNCTKVNE